MILPTVFICSCGTDENKVTKTETELNSVSAAHRQPDTLNRNGKFKEENLTVNDDFTKRLFLIKANVKRINSITNWAIIDTEELWETSEGGEAKYYYHNGQLEKIITQHFGETFQQLTEYYLLDGQLSFVFEKSYKYNRPIYYDTTAMKENKDTEAYDFKKSAIVENRSYFEKGKLLQQLNNHNYSTPFTDNQLLKEHNRLKADFEQLIKLRKTKQ